MTRTGIKAAVGALAVVGGEVPFGSLGQGDVLVEEQVGEGERADCSQFLDHIAHLRTLLAAGEIEVHEELYDGDKYADRHTCHLTKEDGTTVSMEVYVFSPP